jgi:hypothetical protein
VTTGCWRLEIRVLSNEMMENVTSKKLQNFKMFTKIEQVRPDKTDRMCEQQEDYVSPHVR